MPRQERTHPRCKQANEFRVEGWEGRDFGTRIDLFLQEPIRGRKGAQVDSRRDAKTRRDHPLYPCNPWLNCAETTRHPPFASSTSFKSPSSYHLPHLLRLPAPFAPFCGQLLSLPISVSPRSSSCANQSVCFIRADPRTKESPRDSRRDAKTRRDHPLYPCNPWLNCAETTRHPPFASSTSCKSPPSSCAFCAFLRPTAFPAHLRQPSVFLLCQPIRLFHKSRSEDERETRWTRAKTPRRGGIIRYIRVIRG